MSRYPQLKPLPNWLPSLDTLAMTSAFALDVQIFKPGDLLRCWFCNRCSWAAWGQTIRCVGQANCQSYYVLNPGIPPLNQRWRCDICNCIVFQFKTHEARCAKCYKVTVINPVIKEMAALLEDIDRYHQRQRGFLKDLGGPAFKDTNLTNPWQPRKDYTRRVTNNKLRAYRRMEDRKRELGRDPLKDYRKVRHPW